MNTEKPETNEYDDILKPYDVSREEMIDLALQEMRIELLDYKDDNEIDRIITCLTSCDAILHGPFLISEQQQGSVYSALNSLLQAIPKTSVINDYPRAVQLRGIVEKMKDEYSTEKTVLHINKVIDMEEN